VSGEAATVEREDMPATPVVAPVQSGHPSIPFMPGIEGLRGLAVLAVLLFHNGFGWARGGFLAVSTFFTLSGFLITLLVIWEHSNTGTVSIKGFWSRRYRRLMPASLLCLLGVVAFGHFVASPSQLATLRGDVLASLAYVANWRFIVTGQSYAAVFSAPSPVLHFWSLAVEEQFYLVFPVVVFVTFKLTNGSRRALASVLVVLSLLSLASMFWLYTPGQDPSRVYYGTGTRAIEILLGALLALLLANPRGLVLRVPGWAWTAAGLIAGAVVLILWNQAVQSAPWLYEGGLTGYALMSCLIIVAAIRRGPVRSLMSFRPLRWLGAISYGVYLFHWPIYLWLSASRTGLAPWPLFGLRVAVTVAVAYGSYHLLEMPIRRRTFPVRIRPSVLTGATVAVIVVSLFAVTSAPAAVPFAHIALASPPKLAPTTTVTVRPVSVGGVTTKPMVAKVPLAPGEAPRVLLLGDSALLTLGGGLVHWGPQTGALQVWDAGKLGCPIGRGGSYLYLGTVIQDYGYCNWTQDFPREIASIRPQVIVAMFGAWDVADRKIPGDPHWRSIGDPVYDNWLRGEISTAIDTMTAQGATVVWLMQPHIRVGITEQLKGPFPEEDPVRMDRFNQLVREVVATKPRATILDLEAHMRTLPEGELSLADRPDGEHWTAAAALALAPWLGTSLVDVARGKAPLPVDWRG
jgi:peptidoglycan/LPS O-acetylase OafA/YrhL